MITGERVVQLREIHKLTQSALADKIPGLSQYQLSRIEKGRAEPDVETSVLIAAHTGVTLDFLMRVPPVGLRAHSPQYRARSAVTERVRNSTLQWASLIYECYHQLETNAVPIKPRLRQLHGACPQEAARQVRLDLGFDAFSPLPYLVLAVERAGVTVLGLPVQESNLDGFCAWHGERPVIALLDGVPGDRLRFTAAHELGHLVLHQSGQAGREVEAEADAFAAELLTPLAGIENAFPSKMTLSTLAMLKTQWGVSIKSLIRRARELGHIDHDRAISFYKQISSRGWNQREPGHVPVEKARGFRKLAEMSYGPGPNVAALAKDAHWSEELCHLVLDRHATADELPFVTDSALAGAPSTADNVYSLNAQRAQRREG